MTTINYLTKVSALAATAVIAGTISGRAEIDMTCTGLGLSATDVGITSEPGGQSLAVGAAYIGLYQFTVNGYDSTASGLAADGKGNYGLTQLTVGSTFESVCLSPEGDLNLSEHSYVETTFANAGNGLNPNNSWGTDGIQNAAYLWQLFGHSVTTASQGAGLAMAMYEAEYNSTGYGTLALAKNDVFVPNFGTDTTAAADCASYLQYLTTYGPGLANTGVEYNEQTGYILVPNPTTPTADGNGQEFIILAANTPNLIPVPEPTTMISGALLLLPFGASTLRILRKKDTAS
jgi:hypothetical protein